MHPERMWPCFSIWYDWWKRRQTPGEPFSWQTSALRTAPENCSILQCQWLRIPVKSMHHMYSIYPICSLLLEYAVGHSQTAQGPSVDSVELVFGIIITLRKAEKNMIGRGLKSLSTDTILWGSKKTLLFIFIHSQVKNAYKIERAL